MKRGLAILSAALAFGAVPSVAGSNTERPAPEAVDYGVNTWGRPIARWSIDEAGAVRYTHFVGRNGSYYEGDLLVRQFRITPEERAMLDSLLKPARKMRGRPWRCGDRITDAPYGRIAWAHSAAWTVDFDTGCQSKAARRFSTALNAAAQQMQSWADQRGGTPVPEE